MLKTSASTFAPTSTPHRTIHATTSPVSTPIQSHSHLQYIPYQRKVLEYQQRRTIEYVPVERVIVEYVPQQRIDTVPVERLVTDYYTVEHITEYIPEVIPERKVEYVPVEWIENRVEYRPVERQVVHYPKEMLGVINGGGTYVGSGVGSWQQSRGYSPVNIDYEGVRRGYSSERKQSVSFADCPQCPTTSNRYTHGKDRPKYSIRHSNTSSPIYEGHRLHNRSK